MLVSRPIISRLMQQSAQTITNQMVISSCITSIRQHLPVSVMSAVRRYHQGEFKPPSMDELPVPQGSWQARYDANQRKYNATLLFGVAFTVGTLAVAKASGLIFLNFAPPKSLD